MPPKSVHLNGSINLGETENVMREAATRIPSGLRRLPDGETGERLGWIGFQAATFMTMPEFVTSGGDAAPTDGRREVRQLPRLDLRPGVSAAEIDWPELGYARNYLESYEVFVALRDEGVIKAGTRFQMQFPTPLAPINTFFVPDNAAAVMGSYEAALFGELARVSERLPHEDIAVQWDVALEITYLGAKALDPEAAAEIVPEQKTVLDTVSALDLSRDDLVAGVDRCVREVADDVPVGLHLCYGDYGHRHAVEPISLEVQVDFVNVLAELGGRPVDWVAFTVPQDRDDEAFFAPLAKLDVATETEPYFGIVPYHLTDQAPGATARQVAQIERRLAESPAGSRDWGIGQECGLGRAESEEVLLLLDLHRVLLEQYGS